MRKLRFLLFIIVLSFLCSCLEQPKCSAYGGDRNRYQRNQHYWNNYKK